MSISYMAFIMAMVHVSKKCFKKQLHRKYKYERLMNTIP